MMSNISQPSEFINYISQFKKCFVTRNNGIISQTFKIDSQITDTYYFQFVNNKNQIVSLSGRTFNIYGSWVDAKAVTHLLFETDNGTVDTENNILSFKLNTYTDEYLKNIKTTKQCNITIVETTGGDTQVVLRDTCLCYKRPIEEDVTPTPVVAGFGLDINGYVINLTGTVLSGDGTTIEINNNVISCIGGGGTEYIAGEGIGIDNNVISLTATIPSAVSQLTNDNNYLSSVTFDFPSAGAIKGGYWQFSNEFDYYHDKIKLDYSNVSGSLTGCGFATTGQIPTNTSQLQNDQGYLSSIVINIDGTDETQMTSLNLDNSFYVYQDMVGVNASNVYQSMQDSGLFVDFAQTSDIPLSTSQLTNDSDFITSSALTGISVDNQQKMLIDDTVQNSGFVLGYDKDYDIFVNTITTDSGVLNLNPLSGVDSIEVGKTATFEQWIIPSGTLTGITFTSGQTFIGELPSSFTSNYIQVFTRRVIRKSEELTIQQISYAYEFEDEKEAEPNYLTIKSVGGNNIVFYPQGLDLNDYPYPAVASKDKVNWSPVFNGSYPVNFSLQDGECLYLSGDLQLPYNADINHCMQIHSIGVGTLSLSGNIMSLANFRDHFVCESQFAQLFNSCSNLVDASKLELPVMELSGNCYRSLFYGCTYLTAAPYFPAYSYVDENDNTGYDYMFNNCSNLKWVEFGLTSWGFNDPTNWFEAAGTASLDITIIKTPSIGTEFDQFANTVLNRDSNGVLWNTDSSGQSTTAYEGTDPYAD